jgi:hypothetical protein
MVLAPLRDISKALALFNSEAQVGISETDDLHRYQLDHRDRPTIGVHDRLTLPHDGQRLLVVLPLHQQRRRRGLLTAQDRPDQTVTQRPRKRKLTQTLGHLRHAATLTQP